MEEEGEAPLLKFRKPRTEGKRVTARGGHTACVVGTDLVFFGGHLYGGGGKFIYYNDTCVLDLETNTWHVVKAGGRPPAPRYGHTATVIGSKIYVFGGKGQDNRLFNDVFFLDTISWCWVELSSTTHPPPPRFNHAAALVGDKIVVSGGWNGTACVDPSVWIFDTANGTWLQPRTSGRGPSPRQGHCMELTLDGRILVFGGMTLNGDGHPSYLSDLRSLDIETMVWTVPRAGGPSMAPRFAMTSCMLGRYMCCIGGYIQRDASARKAATGSAGGDGVGQRVKDPITADRIIAFDTEKLEWVHPEFVGNCPEDLYGHSIARAGKQVILYGGWGGNRALDELFVGQPLGAFASAIAEEEHARGGAEAKS